MNEGQFKRVHPVPPAGHLVDAGLGDPTMLLTPQEQIFASHYAESRNHYAAFRTAFPDSEASNSTVYRRACEVLRRPHMVAAVQIIRDQMNADTLVRATDMLRDLVDIANANPNDLVSVEKNNCRLCHGVDHKYQWRDATELARAMDAYMQDQAAPKKKGKPPLRMPDPSGGFGFNLHDDPVRDCPGCEGEGIERRIVHDTTKLSPQARKLLKSVEQNADGSVRIVMHDQMKARDMIIMMLGAYKDPKQATPGDKSGEVIAIPKDATQEDAARAYLTLVKG